MCRGGCGRSVALRRRRGDEAGTVLAGCQLQCYGRTVGAALCSQYQPFALLAERLQVVQTVVGDDEGVVDAIRPAALCVVGKPVAFHRLQGLFVLGSGDERDVVGVAFRAVGGDEVDGLYIRRQRLEQQDEVRCARVGHDDFFFQLDAFSTRLCVAFAGGGIFQVAVAVLHDPPVRAEDGVDIDLGTLGRPFDAGDVADTAVAGLERGVLDGLCCQ